MSATRLQPQCLEATPLLHGGRPPPSLTSPAVSPLHPHLSFHVSLLTSTAPGLPAHICRLRLHLLPPMWASPTEQREGPPGTPAQQESSEADGGPTCRHILPPTHSFAQEEKRVPSAGGAARAAGRGQLAGKQVPMPEPTLQAHPAPRGPLKAQKGAQPGNPGRPGCRRSPWARAPQNQSPKRQGRRRWWQGGSPRLYGPNVTPRTQEKLQSLQLTAQPCTQRGHREEKSAGVTQGRSLREESSGFQVLPAPLLPQATG